MNMFSQLANKIEVKKIIDSAILPIKSNLGFELRCNLSSITDGKLGLIIKPPLNKLMVIYPRLGITFNKSKPLNVYNVIHELKPNYTILNHNTEYN